MKNQKREKKKVLDEFFVPLEFIENRSNVKHYKFMRETRASEWRVYDFLFEKYFMCVECITCCVCLSNFCLKFAQLCQYFSVCLFYFYAHGRVAHGIGINSKSGLYSKALKSVEQTGMKHQKVVTITTHSHHMFGLLMECLTMQLRKLKLFKAVVIKSLFEQEISARICKEKFVASGLNFPGCC